MWTESVLPSVAGGLLIGLGALLLLLSLGRIAGISGILHGVVRPSGRETSWKLLFILGLMIGGWVWGIVPDALNEWRSDYSRGILVAAGLLVGFGTRLGSGCTSGHGVCGIGRFSKRSVTATLVFMATAVVTVLVTRHLAGVA